MNKFWTPHLDNLMRRHYPKGDLDELAARLGVTRTAIKNRAKVLGLRRKVNLRRPWTERQLGILRRHYATMPPEWLEEKTHHSRCCIEKKAHALGLHKSHEYRSELGRQAAQRPGFIATRFKKGEPAFNKGLRQEDFMSSEGLERSKTGRFKPGRKPNNARPVGYERIDRYGYVLVKVDERRPMVHKHRHVWQQLHGPIPEGHCVRFRDGDKTNCSPDNLFLISREDNARRTIECETEEQRAVRIAKVTAKRNETIRKDKIRLHWGLPTKTKIVKRW